MTRFRNFSVSAMLFAVGISFALGAEAVPKKVVPKPKPVAVKLKVKPMAASAKLRRALTGKKRYSAAKVKKALRYTATGLPKLTLAKSRRGVLLERVDKAEPKPSTALVRAAARLDPKLKIYAQHIRAPFYTFERPPKFRLIPSATSHVARQTNIKNQGGRSTCVAQAAMAGIESWYKWKHATTKNLSEQHSFEIFMTKEGKKSCWNVGLQTWKAASYLTTSRVCASWPYSHSVPSCNVEVPTSCENSATHGHTSTQVLFSTEYGGTGGNVAENTNYLEGIVAGGNDIVFGIYVAGGDWGDGTLDTGTIDVELWANGTPAPAFGGHAMLMVGYNRPGNYFEFKNSWGADSGHTGYVRLSYEYIQTYAKYGYYIKGATTP